MNHTLEPVIDHESRILILGSFPSVKSRQDAFYYMNPANRFWSLLEMIFNDSFSDTDILIKKKLLKKHHIALFDVIEKCDIKGSSDASIESVKVHDIKSLIKETQIRHIYLNGRLAESLFKKHFPDLEVMTSYLPSSSPANASYRLNDLYKVWNIIGG